ncbi:MAG: hypothetical protein K9I85_00575 [Saprospiraceae bacterium]|nr:hypothetical protein [Saprospiraceae bacterium]
MTRTFWAYPWSYSSWLVFILLMGIATCLAFLPLSKEIDLACTIEWVSVSPDTFKTRIPDPLVQDGSVVATGQLIGYRISSLQRELLQHIEETASTPSPDKTQIARLIQWAEALFEGPAKEWIKRHVQLQGSGEKESHIHFDPDAFGMLRNALTAVEDSLGLYRMRTLESVTPGADKAQRSKLAAFEKQQMLIRQQINSLITASERRAATPLADDPFEVTSPLSELAELAQQELASCMVHASQQGQLNWIRSAENEIIGYLLHASLTDSAILTVQMEHQQMIGAGQNFTFLPFDINGVVSTVAWEGTILGPADDKGDTRWRVAFVHAKNVQPSDGTRKGVFHSIGQKEVLTLADLLIARRL